MIIILWKRQCWSQRGTGRIGCTVRSYDIMTCTAQCGYWASVRFVRAYLYRGIRGGPVRIKYVRTVRRRQQFQPKMCTRPDTRNAPIRRLPVLPVMTLSLCRRVAFARSQIPSPCTHPRANTHKHGRKHTHSRAQHTHTYSYDDRFAHAQFGDPGTRTRTRKIVNSYTYTRRSSSSVAAAVYIVLYNIQRNTRARARPRLLGRTARPATAAA